MMLDGSSSLALDAFAIDRFSKSPTQGMAESVAVHPYH
jgi:hypothetical protein